MNPVRVHLTAQLWFIASTHNLATIYRTQANRNHTVTKFARSVLDVCDITYTKFHNKCSTFDDLTKLLMDPSSRTREWPPSVLILRGLCHSVNGSCAFTCVGWQATLCDPICKVTLHSSVRGSNF